MYCSNTHTVYIIMHVSRVRGRGQTTIKSYCLLLAHWERRGELLENFPHLVCNINKLMTFMYARKRVGQRSEAAGQVSEHHLDTGTSGE